MSLQSAADVPLLISSPNSSSERRISPSWSIAQLKARLEPITGVPASSQQLSLRVGSQDAVALIAPDEEQTRLAAFPLQPYAEITVSAPPAFSLNSRRSPVLDQSSIVAGNWFSICQTVSSPHPPPNCHISPTPARLSTSLYLLLYTQA